jgi:hypothetical protein
MFKRKDDKEKSETDNDEHSAKLLKGDLGLTCKAATNPCKKCSYNSTIVAFVLFIDWQRVTSDIREQLTNCHRRPGVPMTIGGFLRCQEFEPVCVVFINLPRLLLLFWAQAFHIHQPPVELIHA